MELTQEKPAMATHQDKALAFAKVGIFLGLLSGFLWAWDGLLVEMAHGYRPFNRESSGLLFMVIAALCAGLHDLFAAFFVSAYNYRGGKLCEVGRSVVSKPGRVIILGSLIGASCGMGGYMAALQLAPAAYVMPITALYPGVAVILAVFFLKESIKPLAWAGIAVCITGAIVIGYTPADAGNALPATFTLGVIFAIVATVGWGTEGACVTSGMDFIDPVVALNIRYIISSLFYICFLLMCFFAVDFPADVPASMIVSDLLSDKGLLLMACAGVVGGITYVSWYRAMNMTGVSRAMALNISYALWAIVLSAFFTEIEITIQLISGAVCIFVGALFVIGNPKDMINLRNVD